MLRQRTLGFRVQGLGFNRRVINTFPAMVLRERTDGAGARSSSHRYVNVSPLASKLVLLSSSILRKHRGTSSQGLTLVHVRAQLEQLQDTFMG